jgi:hypothetical protein
MECKYLDVVTQTVRGIGSQSQIIRIYECSLKKQSQLMQIEIYHALFQKGLEGSFVSNDCPVAEIKQWNECPYFRERKNI